MKKYMLIEVNTFGFQNVSYYELGELDRATDYGDAASRSDLVVKAELYEYFPGRGYMCIQRWPG